MSAQTAPNPPNLPNLPSDPPLFSLKITNPVTYLKIWWQKVISNEGIDFRFRIRPLTAITLAVIIVSGSFSLRFLGRTPLAPFLPLSPTPQISQIPPPPTPLDTAFTGTLRLSATTQKYYLLTPDSQAITLDVPPNVNLKNLVGRRIFAEGSFNKDTQTLKISDAKEMEILPSVIVPVPTIATPSASPDLPKSP